VWNRLSDAKKTFPELSDVDFSGLDAIAGVMQDREIADSDIVSILDLMGRIQHEHRIMYSGSLVLTVRVVRPPEDPPYLYVTLPLKVDFDEMHAMNRKLAKLVVAGMPGGALPQGIVASFVIDSLVEMRAAA
jgi:hypothetical protein